MNKTNFNVSLDIHDIYSQFTLPIKKGDTTGRLTVTLMEGGKPYQITDDCYAVFAATNPNGGVLHNSCIIQNNKIVYDLTPNTVAVSSKLECEILLYGEGGELLISPRFTIIVYETVYSEEEVASSNEYSSLNMLISAANTIINEVSRKLDNGEFNGTNGIDGQDGKDAEFEIVRLI